MGDWRLDDPMERQWTRSSKPHRDLADRLRCDECRKAPFRNLAHIHGNKFCPSCMDKLFPDWRQNPTREEMQQADGWIERYKDRRDNEEKESA